MNDRKFYKTGIIISIILIVTILGFGILAKKQKNEVSQIKEEQQTVMSSTNGIEQNNINNNILEENKYEEIPAANKTNTKKQNTATDTKKNSKNETNKNSVSKNNTTKTDEVKTNVDPTFAYPVKGEILVDYAKDKLVYSNTLGEWVTHLGIDIKADKTTVVKASAEGVVKSIKNDPRYGLTVVIEHSNGFSTVYSNLLTAEFVNVGEKVTAGQSIGTVGNTASFEILDEPHLHFEILKNNEQIDPNMYLKS